MNKFIFPNRTEYVLQTNVERIKHKLKSKIIGAREYSITYNHLLNLTQQQNDCWANCCNCCGGSDETGVIVACCPDPIDLILPATITNKTGDCGCLPSTLSLIFSLGFEQAWASGFFTCGDTQTRFILDCDDEILPPQWRLTMLDYAGGSEYAVSSTCDPFSAVFDITTVAGDFCEGSFTFSVEEPTPLRLNSSLLSSNSLNYNKSVKFI